ncbi:Beta-arrestin-1 [Cichlidogyrus casuarinus]|uniref:Beta-arrestin-1 n=1 Tax=Cichlidogyrus casuarinus TaxID=1844966 RepID=A0ABD2QK73_9PLAT
MNEFEADEFPKSGTRVFKKCSHTGKITVYLSKRDFYTHETHVDPIEGVILVDPDIIQLKKPIYCQILAAFRYGREDLDVLGLTFRKYLYLSTVQVYPPVVVPNIQGLINSGPLPSLSVSLNDKKCANRKNDQIEKQFSAPSSYRNLTKLQERLIKKLGANAFPFYFEVPKETPASVTLQPGNHDDGKPCGVDYELRTYIGHEVEEKTQKRNSVCLMIRKFSFSSEKVNNNLPIPRANMTKDFLMCPGHISLQMSLEKSNYFHGENISVNVKVDNRLNRAVKKIKLSVVQIADIMLFSRTMYKCAVEELETEEGLPILPFTDGWSRQYNLCPLLAKNRDKQGLALDGKLKNEDTNLASSTLAKWLW